MTHWLSSPNKNYLGHFDLPEGKDLTLTIDTAAYEIVEHPRLQTKEDLKVIRWIEKDFKPFIVNQGNSQSILEATGETQMEDCHGKKITLYIGKYFDTREKKEIDCLRVRNFAPIEREILNPKHPKWETAKKHVKKNKTSIEALRKNYKISKKDYNLLIK